MAACRELDSVSSTLEEIVDRVELELKEIKTGNASLDLPEDNFSLAIKSRSAISEISGLDDISCRICYDSHQTAQIVFPCWCKGTIGAIHLTCLEQWLEESNRKSCELCRYEFQVERTPRYRALQSIPVWLCLGNQRHRISVRNLHSDVLRCLLVTPLTVACSYVCVVAADFYSQNQTYDNFPPARWTTYSLLAMMTLIIFSYFVWMYTAIGYHQRVWFYWWQKTSAVKVTLPLVAPNAQAELPLRFTDKYT
ncbi:E3 ubiquitin-protein ligase MARCH2-like [Belonocnema kinseyi]|uniref:E3 ubiquitin-protein ligase MARCH2-like n=1 Tax=Belonocnema kinseyi TaxID=2817044 RepID=UPI00143CE317|nr:E3 ubiquitin-protein ligase MARCH2-like [Belonocnema kinseyi]